MEVKINLMLIVAAIVLIVKVIDGYKKGVVKEIISLVSLAILGCIVLLAAGGMNNWHSGKILNAAFAVLLLILLGIVHNVLRVVFFSAKVVSKLPVINLINKLLGVVFGALEVVLFLWILYTVVMLMDLGAVEQVILSYTQDSKILTWIYEHNYVAHLLEVCVTKFPFLKWIKFAV